MTDAKWTDWREVSGILGGATMVVATTDVRAGGLTGGRPIASAPGADAVLSAPMAGDPPAEIFKTWEADPLAVDLARLARYEYAPSRPGGAPTADLAPVQDTPMSFAGTLRVGTIFDQGGFAGIFCLEVDDASDR